MKIKQNKYMDLNEIIRSFTPPILVVSTVVGKGIVSMAEALKNRFLHTDKVYHVPIEEMLPKNAVDEDYKRYSLISNNAPFLLNLVYRIPLFYYRKLLREKFFKVTDLSKIKATIDKFGIRTVICTSHRPAFWISLLKYQEKIDISVWGMLSEFGRNLGWKYIFWEVMNGYLSPVDMSILDFPFPEKMPYVKIDLPCDMGYHALDKNRGSRDKVLFVAGHWGQIFISKAYRILEELLKEIPEIKILIVCGKNSNLFNSLATRYKNNPRIVVHGEVSSLLELMGECESIITKPGISTIVEAHAAQRTIFFIKGMPVAENSNNALYAITNYGAKWFNMANFKNWYNSCLV